MDAVSGVTVPANPKVIFGKMQLELTLKGENDRYNDDPERYTIYGR